MIDTIPDGFYLVADSENPQLEWHRAMITGVSKVTHIAPTDEEGKLVGEPVIQEGVIAVPVKAIGTCSGLTDAKFATTTEVYPDSAKVDDANCNAAQVACITSALDYVLASC